jgi:hypothetical protein
MRENIKVNISIKCNVNDFGNIKSYRGKND